MLEYPYIDYRLKRGLTFPGGGPLPPLGGGERGEPGGGEPRGYYYCKSTSVGVCERRWAPEWLISILTGLPFGGGLPGGALPFFGGAAFFDGGGPLDGPLGGGLPAGYIDQILKSVQQRKR